MQLNKKNNKELNIFEYDDHVIDEHLCLKIPHTH